MLNDTLIKASLLYVQLSDVENCPIKTSTWHLLPSVKAFGGRHLCQVPEGIDWDASENPRKHEPYAKRCTEYYSEPY